MPHRTSSLAAGAAAVLLAAVVPVAAQPIHRHGDLTYSASQPNLGGGFIELQGTAEGHAFRRDELDALLALAEKGVGELISLQRAALAG